MSKNIFVTGTGTEIGKTYVAGLLVKKLREAGEKSAYYKAAMSGNDKDADGNLIPGDAKFVKELAGIDLSLIHISEPTRRLRGSRMPSSA